MCDKSNQNEVTILKLKSLRIYDPISSYLTLYNLSDKLEKVYKKGGHLWGVSCKLLYPRVITQPRQGRRQQIFYPFIRKYKL